MIQRQILVAIFVLGSIFGFAGNPSDTANYYKAKGFSDSAISNKLYVRGWDILTEHENFELAYQFGKLALDYALRCDDKLSQAKANFLIGSSADYMQRFKEAVGYYFKALPVFEEAKDTNRLLVLHNYIGIIYANQKQQEKAYFHFSKAAEQARELKKEMAYGILLNNAGIALKEMKNYKGAFLLFKQALVIFDRLKSKRGQSSVYTNLGGYFVGINQPDSAIYYAGRALEMNSVRKDYSGMVDASNALADAYELKNNPEKAIEFRERSMLWKDSVGDSRLLVDIYRNLSEDYKKIGNCEKALYWLNEHVIAKDTLQSSDIFTLLKEQEDQYDNIQQVHDLEILRKNEQISALELKRRNVFLIGLALVLVLVGISAYLFFRRSNERKKANELLNIQKSEIEHQKKEIIDSIQYARRIQGSILPTGEEVKDILGEHFVLFMPKDIVSGDFYWVAKVNSKRRNADLAIVSAVDCTGHGVPGAFMSFVGYTLLNQTIFHPEIQNPAMVLDYVNKELPNVFRAHANNDNIKDGMDASVCVFDFANKKMECAMANNPVYLVRDGKLKKLPADRRGLSGDPNGDKTPFTNHELEIKSGDCVYLFTDGYADQFGGEKGKKFKYKQLEGLIEKIHSLPMPEQSEILEKTIEEWRGNHAQVDDICLIGIRVQ